ncbi:MAG: hypothetical protein KKE20_04685 [Nanoarchaeota archaeon]|nr:hypothetical protein [Nanoarchaeota archaeon]
MVTKKDRRKSGYVTPKATISKKDLIEYDLFINPEYNDWQDYRDSFRDGYTDFKTIKSINPSLRFYNEEMYNKRIRMNKKQRKLQIRRKLRKIRM